MYKDRILALTKRLYPTGRAFNMPTGGVLEKLNKGLIVSENQLYEDSLSTFDSLLPDNINFTSSDATDWERRLGMISNSSVTLSDRKLAIARKLNYPGLIPERSSYLYLEEQLRNAGFSVHVYENRFASGGGYITKTPAIAFGLAAQYVQLNGYSLGTFQLGGGSPAYVDKVANYIDETLDAPFNPGGDLRSTFFITKGGLTTPASIYLERKNEFRQLILQLKPLNTIAYLLVNYI